MDYVFSYATTEGAVRKVNQDSLFIVTAEYKNEKILFAAVCDGVGGMSAGETASGFVCRRMVDWFEGDFADMMRNNSSVLDIRASLDEKLHELNDRMNSFADRNGIGMGTTVTAMLVIPQLGRMLTAHAGDSRLYKITDSSADVLTADHSIVGQDVRSGKITEEMAENDSRQNQLTNCIGAGLTDTSYDYSISEYDGNECYMLCSDGFRKKITRDEIMNSLCPSANISENDMSAHLNALVEKDMKCGEKDNITALLVRLC